MIDNVCTCVYVCVCMHVFLFVSSSFFLLSYSLLLDINYAKILTKFTIYTLHGGRFVLFGVCCYC